LLTYIFAHTVFRLACLHVAFVGVFIAAAAAAVVSVGKVFSLIEM